MHVTETGLELQAPSPIAPLPPEKSSGLVPLEATQISELDDRAQLFVDGLVALDSNSPEFGQKIDQITHMGRSEIDAAAGQSSHFLDRPIKAMDSDASVGAHLAELRRTIEDLDPARHGKLLSPRKLFGLIPFGGKLRNYFDSYRSAQSHIASILARLADGRDELLKDNAAIDVERKNLWATMGKLEQMIHISRALDAKLESAALELEASDLAKSKAIRETALFHARQRSTDLLTQMAVSVQGYLALDLVKKNNVELVKGVDRASTTTVAALRTAVTVAQALTNQKLVLQQIGALNSTTADIIKSTGAMLRSQTGEVHKQAASSTIPLETLKQAFQNIYDTMDSIDKFKVEALTSMKQTVDTLASEVQKSSGYIARTQGASQARLAGANPDPFKLTDDHGH